MRKQRNVATALIVIAILVVGHIVNERRFVDDKTEIDGVVAAVEDLLPNDTGFTKVAVVQLADGSSMRAKILPGCTAFKGQLAHLVGGRSSYVGRSYVVMRVQDPK
jgi:hypothetical protein